MPDGVSCWYRVETGPDGKVVDIRAVDRAEDNGTNVFYVRATSPKDAGRQAFNAYYRVKQRERREKLKREGKCPWCGAESDRAPGTRCSKCCEKRSFYKKRRAARERGEEVEQLDPRVAHVNRRTAETALLRLSILEEVRDVWKQKGLSGLAVWLRRELARLGSARAA